MRLKLAFSMLVGLVLFGQQTNTVYQTLFLGITSGNITSISTNIGQSTHIVYLFPNNAPAHTCQDPTIVGQFEFSFDRVSWNRFGVPIGAIPSFVITTVAGASAYTYKATGAFPFVRFHVVSFDTTDCTLDGYYVGTIQTSVVLNQGIGNLGDSMSNALSSTGLPTQWANGAVPVGGIYSPANRIAPIPVCERNASASITSGSTGLISTSINLGAPVGSVSQLYVCSIAVTTSGTGTFKLQTGNPGCGSGLVDLTPAMNIISSAPFTFGNGMGAVIKGSGAYTGGTQFDLCGTTVGAAMNVIVNYTSLTVSGSGTTILLPGQ